MLGRPSSSETKGNDANVDTPREEAIRVGA